MKSIAGALFWEEFAASRNPLLGAYITSLLYLAALRALASFGVSDREFESMCSAVTLTNIILAMAFTTSIARSSTYWHCLPAQTKTIVFYEILARNVAILAETTLFLFTSQLLFNITLPFVGPVLFATVLTSMNSVMLFVSRTRQWQPIAMCTPLLLLLLWYLFRVPEHILRWPSVEFIDIVATLFSVAVSYFAGAKFASHVRHGGGTSFQSIVATELDTQLLELHHVTAFKSVVEAQKWYFWRRTSGTAIALFVLILAITVGLFYFQGPQSVSLYDSLLVIATVLILFSLTILLTFDVVDMQPGRWNIKPNIATKPISSSELASAIYAIATRHLVIGWIAGIISLLLLFSYYHVRGGTIATTEAQAVAISLVCTIAVSWWLIGLSCTGMVSPHPEIAVGLLFGAVFTTEGVIVFRLIHHQLGEQLLTAYLGILGVFAAGITYVVFVKAAGRGLISFRSARTSLLIWMMLSVTIFVALFAYQVRQPVWYILAPGIATTFFLPVASIPLAVAWNRAR